MEENSDKLFDDLRRSLGEEKTSDSISHYLFESNILELILAAVIILSFVALIKLTSPSKDKTQQNRGFLYSFVNFFGTFFYVGRVPIIPGTFGTIAGMIPILILFYQPYDIKIVEGEIFYNIGAQYINPDYIIYILVIASALIHIFGHWVSDIYSKITGRDDPKEIVIDEVAGIFTTCSLIALFFAGLIYLNPEQFLVYVSISGYYFLTAFVLFRFFDMVKPWPVSWADQNVKGGLGIMLDDQLAAIMSAITFAIMFTIFHYFELLEFLIKVE